jgi:hypothetical protein
MIKVDVKVKYKYLEMDRVVEIIRLIMRICFWKRNTRRAKTEQWAYDNTTPTSQP